MTTHRKKVLILIHDDFLRELLGNLLHKKGFYILNGDEIEGVLKHMDSNHVDIVILDSNCRDYEEKSSVHHINKELDHPNVFLIHNESKNVDYLPATDQMNCDKLSVQSIITWVESQ